MEREGGGEDGAAGVCRVSFILPQVQFWLTGFKFSPYRSDQAACSGKKGAADYTEDDTRHRRRHHEDP